MNLRIAQPLQNICDPEWIKIYSAIQTRRNSAKRKIAGNIAGMAHVNNFESVDTYLSTKFLTNNNLIFHNNVLWKTEDFLWYVNHYRLCGELLSMVVSSNLPQTGKTFFVSAQLAMIRHNLWTKRKSLKTVIVNSMSLVERAVYSKQELVPNYIRYADVLALDDFDILREYSTGNLNMFAFVLRALVKPRYESHKPTILAVNDYHALREWISQHPWLFNFSRFHMHSGEVSGEYTREDFWHGKKIARQGNS